MLGTETFAYDAARMLVFSVDLPIAAQVTAASADAPYLGFKLEFDPYRVAELALKVHPNGRPNRHPSVACTSATPPRRSSMP